jgi:hypothetical protein
MTLIILNWVYAKLEYILGTALGASTIVLDIPHLLLKLVAAIVLGGAGAFGSHLVKMLIKKLSKK